MCLQLHNNASLRSPSHDKIACTLVSMQADYRFTKLRRSALLAAPFGPITKFGIVGVVSAVVSFGCVMGVHAWRVTPIPKI
ncbi:MAG: hypothetical protein K2X53_06230 [Alphaproteobacteria bacterium]|nr:hypothetical protein [Alphaproteobacteria bacterium]